MAEAKLACPKCTGSMERGFVADTGYGQILQTGWSPGEPQPRRFVGGVKLDADAQIPLFVYRCAGCGFVEFYARNKQAEA